MDKMYNLVATGLKDGLSEQDFTQKFCSKFGVSEAKAQKIATASSNVVLKKNQDEKKAIKYRKAFEDCGLVVKMAQVKEVKEEASGLSLEPIVENKPEPPVNESDKLTSPVKTTTTVHASCPKCGSEQVEADECLSCGIIISKYQERQKAIQLEQESAAQNDNNPYATPEASLDHNFINKEGQGSLEGGISGEYELSIKEIFSQAWAQVSGAKGTILLAYVFYMVVFVAISFVFSLVTPDVEQLYADGRLSEAMTWSTIPGILATLLVYPLLAGIVLLGIQRSVDIPITAVSIFNHYGKIVPIILLYIVVFVLTMFGFLLLFLPGLYLSIAYLMALSLMMDRNMGFWQAMETSRKAITRHWFKTFFLYFLLLIILSIASIPMLIGLIWAVPFAVIVHGIVYKTIFGVESVE